MLRLRYRILCGLFLSFLVLVAQAVELTTVRFSHQPALTKLVLNLNDDFKYNYFILSKPTRLVIDLEHTTLRANLHNLQLPTSVIREIRSAARQSVDRRGETNLRIVLELADKITGRVTRLPAVDKYGHRLLISLKSQHKVKRVVTYKPKPKVTHLIAMAPPTKLRNIVIVIDPGHGGKDPGAIGKTGAREKNIVLAIARQLKNKIDHQRGMRAVLTRRADYYISLRGRLNLARKYNADLFVSIHADAFKNRRSNGASVFALSQRGATSEAARWIAAKENYSELSGVNLSGLDDKDGLLRTVLIDLSQTATIGASLQLGSEFLKYLDQVTSLHHNKVEQARFVVLKSPDIPSLLVETGFISNPREERNLSSVMYRNKLAQAIFKGLKKYFWQHPPRGTYWFAEKNAQKYIVTRGDNLSLIATRFKLSLVKLRQVNQLKSDNVHVGQVLHIPRRG